MRPQRCPAPARLLLACAALLLHTTRAQQCYRKSAKSDVAQPALDSYPCNNTGTDVLSCCPVGDVCGEDSICLHPGPENSGYLVGGCTDPTFAAPQCSTHCASYASQNIAWLADKRMWGCCGNTTQHCSTPGTAELFNAVALSAWTPLPSLQTIPFVPKSTLATIAGTPTGTASPPATTTTSTTTSWPSTSQTNPILNSGLSIGAQAGIGVACAAFGLALVAFVACIFCVRRRRPEEVRAPFSPRSQVFVAGKTDTELSAISEVRPPNARAGSRASGRPRVVSDVPSGAGQAYELDMRSPR